MPEVETDAILGKLLYTPKMKQQMEKHGLYHWMIVDTFKYGHLVRSIVHGLQQMHCRVGGEREIEVLFTTKRRDGELLDGVLLINCWSRRVGSHMRLSRTCGGENRGEQEIPNGPNGVGKSQGHRWCLRRELF
jgi:hypothetical protein